ncbi:flagellar basal body P-ring protein FlgI [Zavarzinia sp. CC-PAN008]|uniref:flagellar basal body P-ring protein FlgI n=1 Tax=Zavarzinia sp. CC-PAN008 TaxID=3243332 RepID=UPI003F74A31F
MRLSSRLALVALLLALPLCLALARPAAALSRIKDIADFESVRENQLVGYGLVVGLDGTGDSLRNAPFTKQSLEAMLERLGVAVRGTAMKTDNVAAVMVTASLPAFGRQGARIDVSVSTLGDASNLLGGTLLVTPLLGADGEVYAVAQGAISVAGFKAQGAASSVTRGVPTTGRISAGATIERETGFVFADQTALKINLRNPDFTTATRIAQAINAFARTPIAAALDPSTVQMQVPPSYAGNLVGLVTAVEQLQVNPDQMARVTIDETSGIIVMGADVRISEVAIAQGNLTIRVTETPQVSQPAPFSDGQTTVVPRTDVQVSEDGDRKLAVLRPGVSLGDLVDALNALGIGPRDMISILEAIKAAGALQAEIQVM